LAFQPRDGLKGDEGETFKMFDWLPSPWISIPVLVALAAAALLVWRAFTTKPARVGQRIGLWLAALFFTFFGPFSAAEPNWPLSAWASAINTEKDFKDLWLAMIAMLVFSVSNIADNLIRSYKDISTIAQFMTPVVLAVYFIAIVLGMIKYGSFAGTAPLKEAVFETYWSIVWMATALGVVWEFFIALETKD
jgi:hypothetical protein